MLQRRRCWAQRLRSCRKSALSERTYIVDKLILGNLSDLLEVLRNFVDVSFVKIPENFIAKLVLSQRFRVTIPSGVDWSGQAFEPRVKTRKWCIDGSTLKNCEIRLWVEFSEGHTNSAFVSECLRTQYGEELICIYSGNQPPFKSLKRHMMTYRFVLECFHTLDELGKR